MMDGTSLPNWYRVSVKAAIRKNKKLLLVKEGSDSWDLPGGGLEHNETISQALQREVQEELGVELGQHEPLPAMVWKTYDPVNKRPIIVLVYQATLSTSKFKVELPVRDIQYIDPKKLSQNDLDPWLRPFLVDLQSF